MKFGVVLPSGEMLDRSSIRGLIRMAEDLGYDSLWQTTHTAIPVRFTSRYPYSPDGRPSWDATADWRDPFVSLGFAAAATALKRSTFCSKVSPGTGPVSKTPQ